jgi:hypothetical protein
MRWACDSIPAELLSSIHHGINVPLWNAAGSLHLEHHAVIFPPEEIVASEIVVDFLTISVGERLDPHRK